MSAIENVTIQNLKNGDVIIYEGEICVLTHEPYFNNEQELVVVVFRELDYGSLSVETLRILDPNTSVERIVYKLKRI